MPEIKRTRIDGDSLERLLGLNSSKIGFYAEVKQKIQELEAANLGLRIKKSELQAIFDAISDGVVIYDSNRFVQHRNHVCPRQFPQETSVGKSCRELFHSDRHLHPAGCPVEQALRGESFQGCFTFAKDHEKPRHFDVTATPIEDPSGKVRALVFLRDVTEKRLQELQLLQAEKMSSIGVLAAGVAHEINNPLNSVAGYAEALLRRFRGEPDLVNDPRLEVFESYLNVIIRESYRCKGVIDSLLSFSRKSEGITGRVNINSLLNEVLELVNHKSRHQKIEIRLDLRPDILEICGDASNLRQVFMNLVMNALQAIEGAGRVDISTRVDEGYIVIQVRDNGSGIASAVMDQIWNPFFTTKAVGQGVGLGLAVTYNIVKKHEGEIHVESQMGTGTLFTVRLPVCRN
jgi:two-component system, NtrC family, sensor kinase